MYHLALRISELCDSPGTNHAVKLKDIKIKQPEGTVTVILHTYKHGKKPIKYDIGKNDKLITHLNYYLTKRGNADGPLMIHKSGDPFTRHYFTEQLKKDIKGIGLNPANYNTHGFRHGRASDMAKDGKSDRQIAAVGRWNSNAFLNYIKTEKVSV